jgi:pimeloyl-ACP methyl ester carboxylesterase
MLKFVFTICIGGAAIFSFGQKIPSDRIVFQKLQRCKPPGARDSVLCGTISVIENRETNKGRVIQLNVIVVPALNSDSLLSPIFDIDGGPGMADTKNLFFYADRNNPYRRHHDIVLVDVRGTGKSNGLYCASLQDQRTWQEKFEEMYPIENVKKCFSELSKHADLAQYTTTNVVKDFEEVRKWLGYKKIDLFSLSYGTRVAQVYLKLFPSSVDKCILWSATSIDSRMPLYHALFAQQAFDKLVTDCNHDSLCQANFPDFAKEFYALKDRSPFSVPAADSTGNVQSYKVSWDEVETKIRELTYSPAGLRRIPYLVHQLYLGNFEPFLKLYSSSPFASRIFSEGFYLCVTCSEDVPFIRKEEIDSLTRGTYMGTYRIDQQEQACAAWTRGKVSKDFLQPAHSNVPVLVFSGGFDPVTPTSMAKEIVSHLSNAKLVVIPAMSHMFDGLSHIECFDNIALNFLDQQPDRKLDVSCVEQMRPGPYKVR